MGAKIRYEFDAEREVLIKCEPEDLPKIIRKSNLKWRISDLKMNSMLRRYFLGKVAGKELIL